MIQVPKIQEFVHEADTYKLKIKFNGHNTLYIELEDLIDLIIYGKEYNEEDQYQDIHKKIELSDVYSSLTEIKQQSDEVMTQKLAKGEGIENKYIFGTIIKSKDVPCYKIQKGGLITTYTVNIQKKTGKEVIMESYLKLNKIRDISQKEIMDEKYEKQKKQYLKKDLKMQRLQKENIFLKNKVQDLIDENKKLKQEVEQLKNQKQDKIKKEKIKKEQNIKEPQVLIQPKVQSIQPLKMMAKQSKVQARVNMFQNKDYFIQTYLNSNFVIDISQNVKKQKNSVILYQKHGNKNQRFRIVLKGSKYQILSDSLAIKIKSSMYQLFAGPIQNNQNQEWIFEQVSGVKHGFYIRSCFGGYIDLDSGKCVNEGKIIEYKFHGDTNQIWIIRPAY